MRIPPLPAAIAALVVATVLSVGAASPLAATDAADPPPVTLADTFSRAAIGGWGGAAPSRHWVPDGQAAAFSVGHGAAAITLSEAGSARSITQTGVVARDVDLAARFGLERLPDAGNAFVYLVARRADDAEVRLKVRIDESGALFLQPTAMDRRQELGIGEEVPVPDLFIGAGEPFWLRAQVVGAIPTTIRMRAWRDGAREPEGWMVDATDSLARATGPGAGGVRAYVGSSVTALPLRIAVDDWSMRVLDPLAAATPTPSITPSPADLDLPDPDPAVEPGVELARDDFSRESRRAWGDAVTGERWAHAGDGDAFGVDGRVGVASVPAGETRTAMLPLRQRDLMASATLTATTLPRDGFGWVYLVLRQADGHEVRGRARVAPDGGVHLSISLVEEGEERQLGPEIRPDGLVTGPGTPVRMRFAGVSDVGHPGLTTWRLKAWPANAAEPDGWMLQADDATAALQGAGAAGLRMYAGRSVSNGPMEVTVDDVQLLAADATTGNADPVIAGAGDIAACGSLASERTARLLDAIGGTVMAVGDLANRDGTPEQFRDCYDPTWGRFRDRTLPVLGNREYATPDAAGWFGYWGAAGAPPGGWQARDLGTWRVYALNSECAAVGCGPDSDQLAWLRADIAANPRACTLALFHRPRITSGPHGDARAMRPIWEILRTAGVDVVVSGHDHGYERFLPADGAGALDTDGGIVQFVAGTGGSGSVRYAGRRAGSVVRDGATLGVLRLTLRPDGYDWRFLPVAGAHFTDSGRAACD